MTDSAAAAASQDGAVAAGDATGGGLLRAARERRGQRLDDLAATLKVPRRKLELLEADRYDELPNPTFTRALALSMCRALKIDSEPVLARLPRPTTDGLAQVSLGLNEPFRDRFASTEGFDWRRLATLPMLGGLLLVLGAAAVYWMPMGFWPRLGSAAAPVAGAPAPVAPTEAAPSTTATTTTTVEAAPADAASTPVAVDTVFSVPATPMTEPVVGGVLMLRAASESWIEVRDAAGRVLLSRSLAAGEATGVDGALPLRVIVGNAEATEVTFKGQPVALVSRDNVARLELK